MQGEIGRGGMGTVYEAWQRSLERTVALKVLGTHVGASPNAVTRFQREAQAAAKLHHTHIIPIFAQGEESGVYYYAMEYVKGVGISDIIASTRARQECDTAAVEAGTAETVALEREPAETMSAEETVVLSSREVDAAAPSDSAVSLEAPATVMSSAEHFKDIARHLACVADALDYAHRQGVIHRDIKPHNLILGEDGRIMVADFGLARIAEQPGVTVTGELLGSPLYMSSEQITEGPSQVDHRTDIYSLGVTMYEWLTLKPPFPGETRERVINLILNSEPIRPRLHNKAIPLDLETICLRALERDADKRYQSASEMRDDLLRFGLGDAIKARRAGLLKRVSKFVGRHQLASLAAVALIVAAGLCIELVGSRQEVQTQVQAVEEARQDTEHIFDLFRTISPEARGIAMGAEAVGPVVHDLFQAGQRITSSSRNDESEGPDPETAVSPHGVALRAADELAAITTAALPMFSSTIPGTGYVSPTYPAEHSLLMQVSSVAGTEVRHELLSQVLDINPENLLARQMLAGLLCENGQYQEMLAQSEQLVSLHGEEESPYLFRGLARLLLGDEQEAIEDFSVAVGINGLSGWARALRGVAWVQTGDQDNAIRDLDDALDLTPELAFAMLARACAHAAAGRHDEAVADLSGVLELEPTNADILAARGEHLSAMGKYAQAASDFDRAMKLAGRSPAIAFQYLLARALEKGIAGEEPGTTAPVRPEQGEAVTDDERSEPVGMEPRGFLDRLFNRPARPSKEQDEGRSVTGFPMISRRNPESISTSTVPREHHPDRGDC